MMKDELLYIRDNRFLEKTAFRYNKGENLIAVSYRQFYTDIQKTAGGLEKRIGSLSGTHIGLFAQVSYEALVCMYAVWLSGGVIIPINTGKEWEQIVREIERSEAVYFLADESYIKENPQFSSYAEGRAIPLNIVHGDAPYGTLCDPAQDQLSTVLFTSGTTGSSKGVSISWHTLCSNAASFSAYYNRRKSERIFFCLPLYHLYAISVITSCLLTGRTAYIMNRQQTLKKNIASCGCDTFPLVPLHVDYLQKLLQKKQRENLGVMREICCAGAPCNAELFDTFSRYGIRITNQYGMTENRIGTINLSDDPQVMAQSVGCAFGDTQIRIEENEILLKGSSTMTGYYNDLEATAEAIQDRWLHTGDMGYLDENGYLYITGRKKNLIILSGGENISPERIEALLNKNDRIIEVVVKEKENQVCAEIYCEESDQPAVREWVDEVNQGLAYYQHVTLIEFRSTPFEKTASGKIKRAPVRL